jgi:hypothetical protein
MSAKEKPKHEVHNPYGLKVTPRETAAAMRVLSAYVQERIRVITEGKITDTVSAARLMNALYEFKEGVQDLIKTPAEEAYNMVRMQVLPNLMDDDGITTIGVEGVGRVNLQDDIQVKVVDQELLRDWLKDEGKEDIIKETVNAQTLAAFLRQRITAAAEAREQPVLPPENVVNIKPFTRAVITKVKKQGAKSNG